MSPSSTSCVLLSVLAMGAAGTLQAQDRAVPYALPDGPDVLQAKLAGPVPGSYDVVCDSLVDEPCQLFPGTYQLQTFDRAWRATKSTVVVSAGTAPTGDGRPAPPANPRFEFYSTTAGALSWDRARTPGLRYDVRRDGVTVVEGTSGINFQEREARLLDRDHLYEIVAITPDDRRSEPTRYFLESFLENPDPLTDPAPLPEGGDADRLAPPANLRFDFYTTFSGALSWDRPATPALRYDVRRNGRTVASSTDGINYQERDARFLDTRYVYEVVAIAPDGRRSAASVLTIDDFEQTSGTGPDSGTTRPPLEEPANLRADVYSRTNAELFWDRSVVPGLRYEVTRDGSIVGTTEGTSFYDDSLEGGTTYLYEVVALDTGRRSFASGIEVTTPDGSARAGELEVRDSFEPFRRPEAIDALESVTEFFEPSLPADRPYVEQAETSVPFSREPFVLGVTQSVLIDIDEGGTGTYRDRVRREDSDTVQFDERIATRTHDGTSVAWAGTYAFSDSSSGIRRAFEFTTEARSNGDGTLRQSGEFTKESSGDVNSGNRPIEATYDLVTGGPVGTSRACDPLSGTIVYDSVFVERDGFDVTLVDTVTTIDKRAGDRYWTVRENNLDGTPRDAYRVASIGLAPFCDFPEF